MRGDFSTWNKDRSQNFRGTLHQQGRVLLDRDWNAQTEIVGEWQETAARDAFGAGVAAVPADSADAFKVVGAERIGPNEVEVSLKKGRLWADGLLVELKRDAEPPALPAGVDAIRTATYFGPPIQDPAQTLPDPPTGQRDAVVLETWLEELSAFQNPTLLLEPALGGVDTTERVQAASRLRLYRMNADDTCDSIIDDLKDDFDSKGKLRVELDPTIPVDGDCPVVEAGGFTGFEHRLYRVEIADTDKPAPQAYFKWSHFNGGLVGTGDFDAGNKKVDIKGNKNAIIYSGLNSFYLEALDFDPKLGYWTVLYGAKVTLGPDGTIGLPDPLVTPGDIFKGAIPPAPASGKRFFRLWNGIERVNGYVAALKDLPDNLGIMLQFEAEGVGKYTPSDFWTFEARAGGIGNPQVLVNNLPPQGLFYHRVPLAEVHWTGSIPAVTDIEDCRRPFQPLTKLKTCCTYRVGDGVSSHGDFKKVQDAIDALPKAGGEVCILPGLYVGNVTLADPHNRNVILKGCGRRTILRAEDNEPAILVKYGQNIAIESLAIEAHPENVGILLVGEEKTAGDENEEQYLRDITLSGLFVIAQNHTAIKGHIAQFLTLVNSVIYIDEDDQTRRPAVYLAGDDMLIERNEIRVLPNRAENSSLRFTNDPELFIAAQEAAGGLQIGGGSERVRILRNLIINGTGNGITLGSIDLIKNGEVTTSHDPFRPRDEDEDCCNPDDGHTDDDEEDEDGNRAVAGPPLYDIMIKCNRIFNMGRNGIGIATFFNMGGKAEIAEIEVMRAKAGIIIISKLKIIKNRIERCVNISPQTIPENMLSAMAYGGIVLAFVEKLTIRDNFIVDNCLDARDPICGIFVLFVLGLEISRNEISENLFTDFEQVTPATVKIGPRGGIWIFVAVGQMESASTASLKAYHKRSLFGLASGTHAAKIHENVVSIPLGRSLTLMALGDVSVLGNRFTSFGIQPVDLLKLLVAIIVQKQLNVSNFLQLMGLFAGNVFIFDLFAFRFIAALQKVDTVKGIVAMDATQPADTLNTGAASSAAVIAPQNPLFNFVRTLLRSGFILFSNNQCKLSPQGEETSFAFSSIFIAGPADVGFHDNQTGCDLPDDFLFTNTFAAGGTVRVMGNWFKETLGHVGVSAMTIGLLNATTDNESVHCLRVMGVQKLDRYNLILLALAFGVAGDVAADDGEKLRNACERQSGFGAIGLRMMGSMAVDEREMNAMGVKVTTGGGG